MPDSLNKTINNSTEPPVNALVYITTVEQPDDESIQWLLTGDTLETPASPTEHITIEVRDLPKNVDSVSWETDTWYFFGGLRKITSTDNYVADVLFEFENRGLPLRDDWMYPKNSQSRSHYSHRRQTQNLGGGQTGSKKYGAGSPSNKQPSNKQNSPNSGTQLSSSKTMSMSSDAASIDNVQTQSFDAKNLRSQTAHETLGMKTGGEQDGNNFRDNILNGYVPELAAFSHEGLFSEYYFDRGDEKESVENALFYPSYTTACSRNPVTNEDETFLTVGLNSNISKDMFERPPLNLVIVLDISGSMRQPFDEYYYDGVGQSAPVDSDERDTEQTKMESAIKALTGLTKHLDERDTLGLILFNDESSVAKPLRDVSETDMDAIRDHVRELEAGGSTNMSAGFDDAYEMLQPVAEETGSNVENRVVFITDEMPNRGQTSSDELVTKFSDAASNNVYTSFVGVGLDANPELGDKLSEVRGANHYFIHTPDQFVTRLDDEFEYMVTPLVFDLELEFETNGASLKNVYGAPSNEPNTGTIMNVSTLFPSKTDGEQTKGGVILVELENVDDTDVELVASWEERDGTHGYVEKTVSLPTETETYDNTGIRKAIVLSRYCNTLRSWAKSIREYDETDVTTNIDDEEIIYGVSMKKIQQFITGEWEHTSVKYQPAYNESINVMKTYVDNHIGILNEPQFQQEVDVLDAILTDETE